MKELIGTILRNVLKFGGGALVTKGFTDEATAEAIIGGVMGLFGVIWGIIEAKKAAQNRQVIDANPVLPQP